MLAPSVLLLWLISPALAAGAAPRPVILCPPLPPCRAQAAQVSGPSFAITQGSCDFRFVTARFMTGCQLDCGGSCVPVCETPNSLHVPETSPAVDLHRDLDDNEPNNAQYYVDARTAGGGDRHPRFGIDTANVIFSVGHGAPHPTDPYEDELDVMGPPPNLLLSRVRVGDGEARYLLLASCEVMSHGPRACTATPQQFGCPEDYNPEDYRRDPFAHRNVFARWEPRIAAGLRMACAGSTLLNPGKYLSEQFWQHYRVLSQPVADSILFAMAKNPGEVPLCITHGGRVPATTPLFDRRFTATRNRRALFGKGRFLYAMYPVHNSAAAKDLEKKLVSLLGVTPRSTTDVEDPQELPADWRAPILKLGPMPSLPPDSRPLPFGFRQLTHARLDKDGSGPKVQVHPDSGAVILRWSPHSATALDKALNPLGGFKLFEEARETLTAAPFVSSFVLRIDRVRRRAAETDVPECFEACRYVRLQKWVSLPVPGRRNLEAPMIGPGSEWILASCPGGSGQTGGTGGGECPAAGRDETMFTFDLRSPGRPLSYQEIGVVPPIDFDPVENARQRARLALRQQGYDTEGPDERRVTEQGRPQIAYETPPVHCTQQLLFPFFRFTYTEVVPRHGTEPHEIVIEVPYYPGADGLTPPNRTCSPEPPPG